MPEHGRVPARFVVRCPDCRPERDAQGNTRAGRIKRRATRDEKHSARMPLSSVAVSLFIHFKSLTARAA
jgi:hypothetical protein